MAPSRKSRREKPETPMEWKLPMDLLRQIIARTNPLVRCAATCNHLRREILSPPLDLRITQAAPTILAYLCADARKPIALVHPPTPAATTFCHKHLPSFMSRKAHATLLGKYEPVSSRGGLVVLRRLDTDKRPKSERCSDLCVYDPMSGAQTFFPDPPEIRRNRYYGPKYLLLTAADGIDTSLLLLVFDDHGYGTRAHTASPCGTWGPVRYVPSGSHNKRGDPAIVIGGVIHWLWCNRKEISSYDLGTGKTSSVKLPPTNCDITQNNQLYLATSPDRKLLKLLAIQGFKMFVWLQLPASAADGSGWSLETVIDMEEKLWSLNPCVTDGPRKCIEFEGSGKSTGEVVLLVEVRREDYKDIYSDTFIVFDLATKKMHRQKPGLSLLEIDLPHRLQTMKIFS